MKREGREREGKKGRNVGARKRCIFRFHEIFCD